MQEVIKQVDPEEKRKKRSARDRANYAIHREKIHAYKKNYRAAHREQAKAYYVAHQEENRVRARTYRNAHREERNAYCIAYGAAHRKEASVYARAYRVKHREKLLAFKRLKTYGISKKEFEILLDKQGGVCAVCGRPNWNDHGPHIDHDHVTGKIRGILCGSCNSGLGFFGDSIDTLKRAIVYLEDKKK